MNADELAQFLASGGAHALAWEQRQAFIERTEELEAERAEGARRRLERRKRGASQAAKPNSGGKTHEQQRDSVDMDDRTRAR